MTRSAGRGLARPPLFSAHGGRGGRGAGLVQRHRVDRKGAAGSWAWPLWGSARAREQCWKHLGFTADGEEGLQGPRLAIAILQPAVTGSVDNRYEWMGHSCTRWMEGEGELGGGRAEAGMEAVTCHGGMGADQALGMAGIVREHVVQRVLRADVGSAGGIACWPGHRRWR